MIGATLPQYAAWVGGTVIGVFGESLIADPAKLGLDARAVAVAGMALALRVPM
jgi:predicted branched-subunit amino acid permease